jgi:hypothetical protein
MRCFCLSFQKRINAANCAFGHKPVAFAMQFFPLAAVLLLFSSAAVASQKAQPSPECISHSQVAVLGAGAAGECIAC